MGFQLAAAVHRSVLRGPLKGPRQAPGESSGRPASETYPKGPGVWDNRGPCVLSWAMVGARAEGPLEAQREEGTTGVSEHRGRGAGHRDRML
ncbi:unnamed protein product [Merluccius merluccius]